MIGALRYCLSVFWFTLYHALRVIVAGYRGIPDEPGGVYDRIPRQWAEDLVRVNRVGVEATGLEQLQPGQPYVFASNHLSWVDIWVLLVAIPGRLRFVAKRGLSYVPFLGPALRTAHHIFIDRHRLTRAMAAYDEAATVMRTGISAVVFVEGTRSRDGQLRVFKKGPFVLAIAAGAPVVPVRISGTFEILPRSSVALRPGTARITFGAPIPTAGMTYEDREALMLQCRQAIEDLAERETAMNR
ncbi:MAG: lysophospholipid acyltransferase family protein [Gemmatimonadales bacterium]